LSFSALLLLSAGLAMDATAVSAARGLATPRLRPRHFLLAALFGVLHALMPLLGWLAGSQVAPLVHSWEHWISAGVLAALGARMLWEARTSHRAAPTDPFAGRVMLALGLATSLDALVAGVTLPMLGAPLGLALLTIGLTTGLLSALGLSVGRRFGALLGKRLDVGGGAMLLALAVTSLARHFVVG
jgi:putative Mn2+ efflux pump MntP